ncbi:nitrogenase iron-molybdenum cofactor biosynthesis protein NifN [Halanaerobium saccharolyticum]|jgi:nitrogenase molybdenum-iron protein NifN|uniref:Nitrogenase iron-molybdenum cofactor biosynthesis protein NifN n=1 Tax=Halanaerobium saccharolyticum TaxID=43595 RepID=A0A2T5RJR1_9FIRM|nr:MULTISPECIES: nitrogenase iron-molybdenum cofactor biosynthesis protein NifN [Halanaerobium]KXS48845.1 MAG: nitrogenase molybdenum-iron protein NifN [Halanaerobium sp. T82-1]OEG63169.1 MAG: nitrogenase iron-molybdenum cofactor biosynthesis protein NifN [Halanaerobium sp. MDAL1]PTV98910.1 nitrogenase molybdenum-iron protein NifN [Halanaerobium saccharolyticum]PUU94395.1 MAG: nitrogenase molybdenum-iron protein NifN [Halanaerobium sp.]TDP89034.1 nitrogenase molybdenum-iron protein NifN [Halan
MSNLKRLNVNPCKMCMPIGAAIAFKGIEESMLLMHGSQGCSTYMRRHMSTHYEEPIDIASSSIDEEGTVYGGEENLRQGLKNLIKLYSPKVIGVVTTCLAETIGEDINRIVVDFKKKNDVKDISIITVSTPGYGGSQFEGYYLTLRKIIEQLAESSGYKSSKVNVIAASLSPAEIREIKKILDLFDLEYTMLPDISRTLAVPFTEDYSKIPPGGTTVSEIKKMGDADFTIEFGDLVDSSLSTAVYLKNEFEIPAYRLPIPIGLKNTDKFINILAEISGKKIPQSLKEERGRLIDTMIDSHKYNGEGRAAIFGDPEMIYAVSSICQENGIDPVIMATGTDLDIFEKKLKELTAETRVNNLIFSDTDFEEIRNYVNEYDINIMIGNSDGAFIEEKDGVPLIRVGFPIHDRVGASRQQNIGYQGSNNFLDQITNQLLALKHNNYRKDLYKEYYQSNNDKKTSQKPEELKVGEK